MKTWRDRYFENYTATKVVANNRKGYRIVYTYTGDWYGWDEEEKLLKRRKLYYVLLTAAITVVVLLGGISPAYLNTAAIVVIPEVVGIVTLMYTWIGVVSFCRTKDMMRVEDCKHAYSYIETATGLMGLCYSLAVITGIVALVRNGVDTLSLLVLAGILLCSVLSWLLHCYHGHLKYHKVLEPPIMFDEMPFE